MAPLKSLTREFTPGVSWTLQCEREREVDGVHVYSLFYAKMLALLTPRKLIPQLLLGLVACGCGGHEFLKES